MKYTPVADNKKMKGLAGILFFAGIVSLFMSNTSFLIPGGYWQLIGFCAWAACTYILIRFVLTRYTYHIICPSLTNDHPLPWEMDFVVEKAQGSRGLPMCQLALKDLKALFFVGKNDYRTVPDFLPYRSARFYNYCVNPSSPEAWMLVFESAEGEFDAILVEPGAEMLAYLNRAKNRMEE